MVKMKLASFLIIISCLLIELFAKEAKVKEFTSLEEYTYDITKKYNETPIKNNIILNLKLSNYPPYDEFDDKLSDFIVTWSLNEKSFEEYDFIEFIEKNVSDDFTIFKFHIKEVTNKYSHLLLTMTGDKVINNSKDIFIIFKLYEEIPIINKEFTYGLDSEVIVESNSLLHFKYGSGFNGQLANIEEILKSEYIEYIGISGGGCEEVNLIIQGPEGEICDSPSILTLYIKNVTDEKLLPKIVFSFEDPYNKNITYYETTLKLQSNTECIFKGYKCCSEPDAKVCYTDVDGKWGIENEKWCFIKNEEKTPTNEPKDSECFSLSLGFPCCDKQNIVYVDDSGSWGFENGDWCGIKSCSYQFKDGYPVCKSTSVVLFTDSDEWGVENGEWCVMCNYK